MKQLMVAAAAALGVGLGVGLLVWPPAPSPAPKVESAAIEPALTHRGGKREQQPARAPQLVPLCAALQRELVAAGWDESAADAEVHSHADWFGELQQHDEAG